MTRINGRTAFLQLLVDEGVTHLFGNPGTTELPIMEVVPDFPQLKFVLGLHEAVVMATATAVHRTACQRPTSTWRPGWATRWARSSMPSFLARP